MAVPQDIILGDGVFAVGGTDIALTRGGGSFTVEREYRNIDADGDYGPVKGRIRKTRSVAKLKMNALELLPANLVKIFPSTEVTSGGGTDTFQGKADIEDADYASNVTWTGKTKGGRPVVIQLDNAICLENLDWSLIDKEEIVPEVIFTAAYAENARTTEPWKVTFSPA